MYYYNGYNGGYNAPSYGCNTNYPIYYGGYGYSGGYGNSAAIILVLFILLVIIIGARINN